MPLSKIAQNITAVIFLSSNLAIADATNITAQGAECASSKHPYRITARHIEPQGIGYSEGYTTLEGFFSLYNGWDNWVPFLDVRGHVFNNGNPAVNAGLGIRNLRNNRIWGLNSYYDYRNTKKQNYNQIALGVESLGQI